MGENIDIKIREDGSRVVSRNLDDLAGKADKADKAIDALTKTVANTGNTGGAVEKLRALVRMAENYGNGVVKGIDQTTRSYRNALIKHFEDVSKQARASSAAIKSSMETIVASPVNIDQMNDYYRKQEALDTGYTAYLAGELAKREAADIASANVRFAAASKAVAQRTAAEQSYTQLWANMLGTRDKLEQDAVLQSVKNLQMQEAAEKKSFALRLKNATQAITTRKAEEASYTSWWATELSKRDSAQAASTLRTAQQRSGMQAFNTQRMEKNLIAPAQGTTDMSKFYAAQATTNLGGKTAGQLAEYQATQRQMAMMQLMLPMMEKQVLLDAQGESAVKGLTNAKNGLTTSHGKLANAARSSGDSQGYWNGQAKEAHALARGLSGTLGTLWLTYGSILPLLVGAALGSAFIGAAKAGSELSYQLTFVKALGGESQEAIDKLRNSTLELSKISQYGPTDIANGYRILAQAGISAADALKIMPNVLNLATAGEMNMEQAGMAVVGTLNAFNLGIEKSQHVTDVFAKAAAVSQTSVLSMTESMKTASTVGQQYHQTMEGTATALALLAKVNITGTAAGTSFRNMLKEMYTPTKAITAEWKALGISMETTVTDKMGKSSKKVRDFADVVYDLKKKMDTLDQPSQLRLSSYLSNERGSKELVAMLNLGREEWDKFYADIGVKSDGFAKKVNDELNKTAKGEWKIALNNMESELTKTFNSMEPQFISLAQKFQVIFNSPEFTTAVTNVVSLMLKLTTTLIDLAPQIYLVAQAWLVLKTATITYAVIQSVVTGFTAMGAAISATRLIMATFSAVSAGLATTLTGGTGVLAALGLVSNPLGIILGLLAAGAAAWYLWGNNAETASGKAIKSTQERLAQLKKEKDFGVGEIGDAKAKLSELTNRSELMNSGPRQPIENLKEAQKAVDLQQNLVDLLEERQAALTKINTVSIPKIEVPKPQDKDIWMPPVKVPKVHTPNPSGKLNDDDKAIAKLQAKLQASEKEYAVIMMTGQAQYQLNEGQSKSLELQQKIEELTNKSTSGLREKGLKGRQEQLAAFKEELSIAQKLDAQLQAIELLKVNTKLDEEVRMTQLVPLEREKESKWLTIRNELLGKGNIIGASDEASLRKKIEYQIELNKQMAVRDSLLANSDSQKAKDLTTQNAGANLAKSTEGWTQNDTNTKAMSTLSGMGIDTSQMQQQVDTQLEALRLYYAQVEQMKSDDWLSDQAYASAKTQLNIKESELRLSNMHSFFGSLAGLQTSSNKELGAIGKAAAITQATMDGVNAVQKAYTGSPYPWNIASAAAQGALAAANVAKIAGLNFATGGSFIVGGAGGVDSQNVSLRASPGEKVTVSTPQQVRHGNEQNKNQQNNSNNQGSSGVKIINVLDPNLLHDYLSTPAGEKVLVNTLQRNAGAVRSIVNG